MQYSIKTIPITRGCYFYSGGRINSVDENDRHSNRCIDSPNMSRKVQKEPVPYLGGVAISIGIVIVSYAALLYTDFSEKTFGLATSVWLPTIVISTMGVN